MSTSIEQETLLLENEVKKGDIPFGLSYDNKYIVMVDVEFLLTKADPRNPRTISSGAMARLVGVISEHGFIEPCIYNKKLDFLIGGHQRLLAAQSLGYIKVPCVIVEYDDLQHRAANIALNAEYGIFDDEKLKTELFYMKEHDFDLDFTGLPPFQIEHIFSEIAPIPPSREVPIFTHTCPRCGNIFEDK